MSFAPEVTVEPAIVNLRMSAEDAVLISILVGHTRGTAGFNLFDVLDRVLEVSGITDDDARAAAIALLGSPPDADELLAAHANAMKERTDAAEQS